MRITVLGSGNAFCADGRGHASFLLESAAGGRILLDAGATTLQAANRFGVLPLDPDAIVLTHFHGDHAFGLPFLLLHLSEMERRTRPLMIAGPQGVEERCTSLMRLAYGGFVPSFGVDYVDADGVVISCGGFDLESRQMTHSAGSLGYRVREPGGALVAFSGDSAFDEALVALVRGADLAVIELTLLEQPDPPLPHISVQELRERKAELEARGLLLAHLDDSVAREAQLLSLGTAAHDGQVIRI